MVIMDAHIYFDIVMVYGKKKKESERKKVKCLTKVTVKYLLRIWSKVQLER